MKRIKIQRVSKRILARCAAVLLVVGVGTLVAFAGNPTMFLPIDGPIGIAASPERILVMTFCDDPRQIMQVDGAGVVTPFATLPPREPGCLEDDIHFSSGLGGWPAGYVFATQGTYIYKISPDGAFVSLFAMIPTAVSGLVFDKVGSFGYDMIVIGGYSVYRVTPAGTVTMLGGFNERVEGPDVAPMSFGPYGGFLFAGANSGYVMAMAPTGGYDGRPVRHAGTRALCSRRPWHVERHGSSRTSRPRIRMASSPIRSPISLDSRARPSWRVSRAPA
ncbi:MAG: hypothetical protein IPF82_03985 [Blastocatellia bacterium]|nr:hypothetical protein [Blastocatellia bacterium]